MISTIIFDLDGTMVDSERVSLIAWQMALERLGYTVEADVFVALIGLRLEESLARIVERFDGAFSAETLLYHLSEAWDEASAKGLPAMPGLFSLIEQLHQRNIGWGVATASTQKGATRAITDLGLLDQCVAIAGGDEVVHSKPAPDVYLLCAERMGVEPADCLVIEDSVVGHRAAASAGMTVVAVPNHWADSADFTQAHYIFDSLHQVGEHLDHLLATKPFGSVQE